MADIDRARAAVARQIVKTVFGKEYDPRSDVSGRTSDPTYQAMYAERFNDAGGLVVAGGKWRWITVLPGDIQKVTMFGHFYALAYSHLAGATSLIDTSLTERLTTRIEDPKDLDPTGGA